RPQQLEHLGAAAGLAAHRDVLLPPEQRGHRPAHQGLVVGEQHPDHRGTCTVSSNPCGSAARVRITAPAIRARSRSPRSPFPPPAPAPGALASPTAPATPAQPALPCGPAPSSAIVSRSGAIRTVQ